MLPLHIHPIPSRSSWLLLGSLRRSAGWLHRSRFTNPTPQYSLTQRQRQAPRPVPMYIAALPALQRQPQTPISQSVIQSVSLNTNTIPARPHKTNQRTRLPNNTNSRPKLQLFILLAFSNRLSQPSPHQSLVSSQRHALTRPTRPHLVPYLEPSTTRPPSSFFPPRTTSSFTLSQQCLHPSPARDLNRQNSPKQCRYSSRTSLVTVGLPHLPSSLMGKSQDTNRNRSKNTS